MVGDIDKFCQSCHTCAVSKLLSRKPHGKLKTMPVPTRPWQYIGIDFVGPLPESSNRTGSYDMICVVIDLLTSMVHIIPTKQTYRALDIAELMFDSTQFTSCMGSQNELSVIGTRCLHRNSGNDYIGY